MLKKILAVVAQLVEHRLPKPRVTGSSPAYRSFPIYCLGLLVALSTLLSGLILTNKKKGGEINGSYICSISYRITMCNFSHLLPYPFRQKMAKSKSHDLKI